jgi:hypothetical protein
VKSRGSGKEPELAQVRQPQRGNQSPLAVLEDVSGLGLTRDSIGSVRLAPGAQSPACALSA